MSRGDGTATGMSLAERVMSREGRRKDGIIAISTSKRADENYTEMENIRMRTKKVDNTEKEVFIYSGSPHYRNPRLAAAAKGLPPKHFKPPVFSDEEILQVQKRREESGKIQYIGYVYMYVCMYV